MKTSLKSIQTPKQTVNHSPAPTRGLPEQMAASTLLLRREKLELEIDENQTPGEQVALSIYVSAEEHAHLMRVKQYLKTHKTPCAIDAKSELESFQS
jgi:hypothetical protein